MSLRLSAGICAVLLLLAGCGGGGGDSSGGNSSSDSSGGGGNGGGGNGGFSVSFNTSNISLTALQGGPVFNGNTAVIQAQGSGQQPEALYIGVTGSSVQGVQSPIQVQVNPATNSATITVLPDISLPAGIYTGTLVLNVCTDAICSSHFRGSPHNVSYSVTIDPRPTATLSGFEGVQSEPAPLQIRGLPPVTTSDIRYFQGINWLSASIRDSTLTLTANASELTTGTYRAVVSLNASVYSVDVPVTLTVTSAWQMPLGFAVVLNGQTQPSDLQGSFTVGVAAGAPINSWSATSNADWLVLDNAAGAPNGTLSWHLDPIGLGQLANSADHIAQITISGDTGVPPTVLTVNTRKQLPEITNVERLGLLANEAGSIAVYGTGFNSLQNPAVALQVTGATPTAVSVLSDQMMSVTFPPLLAGTYELELPPNSAGIPVGGKKPLTVLDPVTRNYQTIMAQGSKRSLLWDAITQSAFMVNATLETVMRFDMSGDNITVTARGIPGLRNIGLPLDRSVLYAVDVNGTLHDLDPVTLDTARSRSLGSSYSEFIDVPLAITGDDVLWTQSENFVAYDLLRSAPKAVFNATYDNPWGLASPNGQRVILTQTARLSPSPPMLYWDVADGQIRSYNASDISFFYNGTVDRQAQNWIFDDNQVRGFDLGIKGLIELPADWFGSQRAISRDGARLYVYAMHDRAIGTLFEPEPIVYWPRVYVFDISTPPVQTTGYPLIGQVELPDYPACRATQGPIACNPFAVSIAITDDDRTLLVTGDEKLIVVPIPEDLRSH
jgi:hypothetical protein